MFLDASVIHGQLLIEENAAALATRRIDLVHGGDCVVKCRGRTVNNSRILTSNGMKTRQFCKRHVQMPAMTHWISRSNG